jgi:hypothetical protein
MLQDLLKANDEQNKLAKDTTTPDVVTPRAD